MRIINKISQEKVWEHWKNVEHHTRGDFRRSVAFAILDSLVGCPVFIGYSPDIIKYKWVKKLWQR